MSDQRRRRLSLPIVIAGAVSSLVLAFGMSPTFSAFTAQITNSTNTAGAGSLVMEEKNSAGTVTCLSTDGGSVSTNSATCSTINKYGGDVAMYPGETVTTSITIKNVGLSDATTFMLTPGACVQSNNGTVNGTATDLCTKVKLLIKSGSTTLYTGTAAAFTTAVNINTLLAQASVAAGATVPISFAVTLDSTAGNTYQGLKVTQPLTWNFQA